MKSLDTIYPEGSFLATRLSESATKWVPGNNHGIESHTGHLLACAGDLPLLVHKSVMAPAGLSAMAACGVSIARNTETYLTAPHYEARVRERMGLGQTAAFSYSQNDDDLMDRPVLVSNDLLQFLNNKGNIATLADRKNVVERFSANQHIANDFKDLQVPIVLKVATNAPNTGGAAVYVCRKRRHLKRTAAHFLDATDIIAEQYIDAVGNWCIQFAVLADGTVLYGGASQQICFANGIHAGSLIEAGQEPPAIAVDAARNAVCAGAQRGFIGACGVDVLLDRTGAAFVVDLNFRPVSSTAFVHDYTRRFGKGRAGTARLAFCQYDGALARFLDICRDGFEEGWLVPLATFDPDYGNLGPGPSRIRMMIVADNMDRLMHRERDLSNRNIQFDTIADVRKTRPKWPLSISRFFRR